MLLYDVNGWLKKRDDMVEATERMKTLAKEARSVLGLKMKTQLIKNGPLLGVCESVHRGNPKSQGSRE